MRDRLELENQSMEALLGQVADEFTDRLTTLDSDARNTGVIGVTSPDSDTALIPSPHRYLYAPVAAFTLGTGATIPPLATAFLDKCIKNAEKPKTARPLNRAGQRNPDVLGKAG